MHLHVASLSSLASSAVMTSRLGVFECDGMEGTLSGLMMDVIRSWEYFLMTC